MPPAERSPNEEEQRHEVSDQPLSLDATRLEQVRAFSLVNSAVNVTLLAFAAAAPGARRDRSISPACRAHSSKLRLRPANGTDRRTDRRTPYRYVDPAVYYTVSEKKDPRHF